MFFTDLPPVPPLLLCQIQGLLSARLHENRPPCLFFHEPPPEIYAWSNTICQRFDTVVILGTGGSSLGGQVLCTLLHGEMGKRILFLDEIHPAPFFHTLSTVDPAKTAVIAVSKSGATAETLCQLLAIFENFLDPYKAAEAFFVLTETASSPLGRMAEHFRFPLLPLSPDIGGRFSVFTPVGVLPALLAGVDVPALIKGARGALAEEALSSCAVAAHWARKGYNPVLFSYDARLSSFCLWQRQLWAESLGKKGKGTTPLVAQGTGDQHSQLQLYLDGPRDKCFTFLTVDEPDRIPLFDGSAIDSRLAYLKGRTMGDLCRAERQATFKSLEEQGIPIRRCALPHLGAEAIGALLAYAMLEVIVVADFLEIDPFGQPAVERIKILTREILS